jgi:hypothetical protein
VKTPTMGLLPVIRHALHEAQKQDYRAQDLTLYMRRNVAERLKRESREADVMIAPVSLARPTFPQIYGVDLVIFEPLPAAHNYPVLIGANDTPWCIAITDDLSLVTFPRGIPKRGNDGP